MEVAMSSKKSIDEELEDLTTIYQRGGGIGEPDLKEEIGRRIDLLKHRQAHDLNKKRQCPKKVIALRYLMSF
jgi:hypothetical protein